MWNDDGLLGVIVTLTIVLFFVSCLSGSVGYSIGYSDGTTQAHKEINDTRSGKTIPFEIPR